MAGLRFRRADPLTWDDPTRTKFSNFPPKSKDQTYTLFDIRANANNINPTDKMKDVLTLVGLPLLIPNRDFPNGYSTVMPAELQSVAFVTLSRPHKTLTTHKLACSCFAAIFGYQ